METTTEPAPAPSQVRVVERTRARRPLARLFWVLCLVVPLALTAVVVQVEAPALEESLQADALAALDQGGFGKVRVAADGRQLTAEVPTGTDALAVKRLLEEVPGVLSVETTDVFASAKEARACTNLAAKLDRATGGQRILFAGGSTQLTAQGQQRLRAAAQVLRGCAAPEVIVGGHTDATTAQGSTLSLRRARTLIKALVRAGVGADRMEPRGYGDQFRVAERGSDKARTQNERGSIVLKGV